MKTALCLAAAFLAACTPYNDAARASSRAARALDVATAAHERGEITTAELGAAARAAAGTFDARLQASRANRGNTFGIQTELNASARALHRFNQPHRRQFLRKP
jgi:hypothetical protein